MYVCICNAITDEQIRRAAEDGVDDLWGLQAKLGVGSNCGSCKETASNILRQSRRRETTRIAQPKIFKPGVA